MLEAIWYWPVQARQDLGKGRFPQYFAQNYPHEAVLPHEAGPLDIVSGWSVSVVGDWSVSVVGD